MVNREEDLVDIFLCLLLILFFTGLTRDSSVEMDFELLAEVIIK